MKRFLKFVEIQTKITSLFAFMNTLAFMIYQKQPINVPLMVIFFVAMFVFDLTTTGINNYIDSKDYPEMLPIPRKVALVSIITMLSFSTVLGLYLAYRTGIVVLLLGAFVFCWASSTPSGRFPFPAFQWANCSPELHMVCSFRF